MSSPLVNDSTWQEALCAYTGLPTLEAFYGGFDDFLAEPLEDRLSLLETLVD